MYDFRGKVALVTGATSGIGKVTALAFARAGASVVLTGRREKEGAEVAGAITAAGGKAVFLRADASKEADAKGAVECAERTFGGLHFAFNNAGVEATGPVVEADVETFRRVFDLNVLGVLLAMKYQIPALLRAGGGSIVNNASVAGSIGMPGASIYIASKHAVIGLTKSAALEVAKQNIRINPVSPATIDTDMFDRFVGEGTAQGEQNRQYMASLHPIGRVGRSEEIADPVLFLCTPGASFITGHDLKVDGGLTVP
ncbi:MAG: glucose 1-dehydrogenase [Phycisphaerales bacterium]